MKNILYLAFFLSGAAGLIYESIWSRYLGLFVGHTAYAQVIVLTIFLGGLSLGAILAGQKSESTRRPLLWYAGVELFVGVYGVFFHDLFLGLQELAYSVIFPGLGDSPLLMPVKWGLVAILILPPSILLGTTFPFMSAGLIRLTPGHPGRVLSVLYFANSFGAALGALVAGFVLLGLSGLPGTVLVAATLNVIVALMAWVVEKQTGKGEVERPEEEAPLAVDEGSVLGLERAVLWRLLLGLSFGTALASFIYEVAWIRMLSLVLGTATHSFELMLSAFILGLALGAIFMRKRADRIRDPIRVLGWIQWAMGAAALATLPLYVASFGWTAEILSGLSRTPAGYSLFTLSRYGIALLIMLPATFCAGMTLPLITRTLFSAGEGERAIGWVYGVNTMGSIVGVVLASLLLLPLMGLKSLLVLGGGLDMALGVLLFSYVGGGADETAKGPVRFRVLGAAVGTVGLCVLALAGVQWDHAILSSGVYRVGRLHGPDTEVLYYEDGRTATVSAYRVPPGTVTLATNGKPDASLTEGWFSRGPGVGETEIGGDGSQEGTAAQSLIPLSIDEPTQILTALVTLAHNPDARTGMVIGQGSGLSSHMLLGSPNLESLVTVEIEPKMLEGSKVFLPAVHRVFEDPRSRFVIDDAKSFLARGGEPLDLILSEPSNPWVSGVSSLFTQEFYARVRDRLAPGGIFGQWLHLYEINDYLVLSVLAALHQHFPSYRVFLVNALDILIVAGGEETLAEPDWGVFDFPGVEEDLSITHPFSAELLEGTRFLDREGLAPLLEPWPNPNSDFFPVLDLGAERARFLGASASGFLQSASGAFDLSDLFFSPSRDTGETRFSPVPEIPMARALALRNRTREALPWTGPDSSAMGEARNGDLDLQRMIFRYQQARALLNMARPPADWPAWLQEVLQGGGWTSILGWRFLEDAFLPEAADAAERLGAPAGVSAALAFVTALQVRDWDVLVSTSEILVEEAEEGRRWVDPGVLLEAGVAGRLSTGSLAEAEEYFGRASTFSGRTPTDFRSRLLRAHLDQVGSPR